MTVNSRILIDKDFREKIVETALADAEAKAFGASMNGAWNDGGASTIRRTVEDWLCGIEGRVPSSLMRYHDKILHDEDPEYAEYVRLSKKFNKEK